MLNNCLWGDEIMGYVFSNDHTMVDAKHLKYNGGFVHQSNMELYTVPEDFF